MTVRVQRSKLLVICEEAIAIEPAQLLQRFVLDLADTLSADLQLFAHFGQRVLMAVTQSEPELENQPLTRGEGIERRRDSALQHALTGGLGGDDFRRP